MKEKNKPGITFTTEKNPQFSMVRYLISIGQKFIFH